MPFRNLKFCLRVTLCHGRKRNYYFKTAAEMKGIEVDKGLGTLLVNSVASQTTLTQLHIIGEDDIIV